MKRKNKGGRSHRKFSKAILFKASCQSTLKAAARVLGVSTPTARKALRRNKLPIPNLSGLGIFRAMKKGPALAKRYDRGEIDIRELKTLLKTNFATTRRYLKAFGVAITKKGGRRCQRQK